jgi:hypothetical protein
LPTTAIRGPEPAELASHSLEEPSLDLERALTKAD